MNKLGIYPGTKITMEQKQKRLYHYTSFESFVKIWLSQKLLMSPAIRMNDILERNKLKILENPVYEAPYKDCLNAYKQLSLTMDYDSYKRGCMSNMMWGHYGKSGEGVCIELDPNRLNFEQCIYKPVEYLPYTPLPPILPTPIQLSEIGAFVNEHLDEFFFQKDEEWRGENEFRVISNQIESLDINGAVTCVYVTSACSQVCKFVEQLTNGLPVMYFHYTENGNIRVPILSDTIKYRKAYTKDIRTNVPIDMTGYSLVNI